MKRVFSVAVVMASALISGCALVKQYGSDDGTMNPVKIHQPSVWDEKEKRAEVTAAREIPIDDYYAALRLAKTRYQAETFVPSSSQYVKNYVYEGIGLVNAYCSRWFNKMDDMARMLAYTNKNVNVITQLTTALLGVGGASSAVVATWGAGTTAYAGAADNFQTTFLLAPTASKVRDHIEAAMREDAERLKNTAESITFKEAYTALEAYANLCTHAKAKEIVDKSLDLSKSSIDAQTGALITQQRDVNDLVLPRR